MLMLRYPSCPVALLSFAVALGACLCLLPAWAEDKKAAPEEAKKERLDFYGDPLPPGAVARIGCVHLRHPGEADDVKFVDDGKTLVSSGSDSLIRFWDVKTGQTVRTIAVPGQFGGKLVKDLRLHFTCRGLWDIAAKKKLFDVSDVDEIGKNTLAGWAISADGSTFAASTYKDIFLIDTASGKVVHTLQDHKYKVVTLAFSADGKTLASADEFNGEDYGPIPDPSIPKDPAGAVRLWDVASGKLIRKLEGHELEVAAVAFSPDGKTLVASGRGGTVAWNLVDAQEPPKRYKVRAAGLTFSEDSKLLAGDWGATIFVADLADLDHPRTMTPSRPFSPYSSERNCTARTFSPDGKTLATAHRGGAVRLWAVKTGEELLRPFVGHQSDQASGLYRQCVLGGQHGDRLGGGVTQIQFSADGKRVATAGGDNRLIVWDVGTGKELRHFDVQAPKEAAPIPPGLSWLALSADGKFIAGTYEIGHSATCENFLKIWEVDTGKQMWEFCAQAKGRGGWANLLFLPGGRLVATDCSRLRCWDVSNGKEIHLLDPAQNNVDLVQMAGDRGTLVLTLDQGLWSRSPAIVDKPVSLWGVSAGKRKSVELELIADVRRVLVDALGRRVITITEATSEMNIRLIKLFQRQKPQDARDRELQNQRIAQLAAEGKRIRVWDTETGRLLANFTSSALPVDGCYALSPDGNYLICIPNVGFGTLLVYELATQKEVGRWESRLQLTSASFTPDGKMLATGCADGTVLCWDVFDLPLQVDEGRKKPAFNDDQHIWEALDSNDGSTAYQAISALAKSPGITLELCKAHLQREPARDPAEIKQLIADLDSDDGVTRGKAHAALAGMNMLSEPELREALQGSPSPEVTRRVEALLDGIDPYRTDPGRLRELRAIQMLEYIGSAEARSVLEDLAKGEGLAQVTKDARAARQRLAAAADAAKRN